MNYYDLTPEVKIIALNLMEGLSCPRSLTVAILIKAGDWVQLANLRTDPREYKCAESYWAAVTATSFLRKCADLPTGIDTEEVAKQTWWASEHKCYETNLRMTELSCSGRYHPDEPGFHVWRHVDVIRKEVIKLIGSRPPDLLQGRFGPGATISDKSRLSTVADKMSSVPSLTPNAVYHVIPWMGTTWGQTVSKLGNDKSVYDRTHSPLLFVRGNKFFTVLKDALTDRGCGTEPSINGFYQAACGQVMRRRMRREGIDLLNGQSIHRQVACAASKSGELCTIDLSSASDSIATNLVKLLLPPQWFDLLDSLRSPMTEIDGKWVKLEKFSSMGNGFTFELETVLFTAITRSVQKTDWGYNAVSVYGDDIICAQESFSDVIALLKWCGFTPNSKKTFNEGHFRESCGGDFFNGVAVRPFHLEEFPSEPQDYISLANGIRRLAHQELRYPYRFDCVKRAWFSCLDNIPSNIRLCRGPEALGDVVIHDDTTRWTTRWRSSKRYIKCYRPATFRRVKWEGFAYEVQFATALYLAGKGQDRPVRSPEGDLTPRDAVLGYKVGWTLYS